MLAEVADSRAHKKLMAEEGNEHRFPSTLLPAFGIKNPSLLEIKMNGLYPNYSYPICC